MRTVGLVINLTGRELRPKIEVSQRPDLVNPPVRCLEAPLINIAADEDEVLCFKFQLVTFGIKDTIGKQIPTFGQHAFQRSTRILPRLVEIPYHLSISSIGQLYLKLASISRLQTKRARRIIDCSYVSRDQI